MVTTPHNSPSAEAVAALDDYTEALQTFRSVGTASACAEADRLRARLLALLPKAEPQPSAEREALLDLIPADCRVVCREGGGPENQEASLAISLGRLAHRYEALRSQPAAPQAPAAGLQLRCDACDRTWTIDAKLIGVADCCAECGARGAPAAGGKLR